MKLLFLLNLMLSVIALLAFFAATISPLTYWPVSVLALLSLPSIILEGVFLCFWLVKKWKNAWLPLVMLAIGWPMVRATLPINFKGDFSGAEESFSVLTYNVSVFDLYRYNKDEVGASAAMIEFVAAHPADIKCFQEYYQQPKHPVLDVPAQMKKAGYQHKAVVNFLTNRVNGQFGMAVFSKFPILEHGKIDLGGSKANGAMFADISTPVGNCKVINVHLESLRLEPTNFTFNKENYKDKSKDLLKVFRRVAPIHAKQLKELLKVVNSSPYPVILCGDLNETPYSYVYRTLSEEMKNGFEESGIGFGFTLNKAKLFFLRIDHQFYTPQLKAVKAKKGEVDFSEHFPLEVYYTRNID